MEKVIRRVSFEEAEKLDLQFWSTKTIEEKWKILTQMREEYHNPTPKIKRVIKQVPYDR